MQVLHWFLISIVPLRETAHAMHESMLLAASDRDILVWSIVCTPYLTHWLFLTFNIYMQGWRKHLQPEDCLPLPASLTCDRAYASFCHGIKEIHLLKEQKVLEAALRAQGVDIDQDHDRAVHEKARLLGDDAKSHDHAQSDAPQWTLKAAAPSSQAHGPANGHAGTQDSPAHSTSAQAAVSPGTRRTYAAVSTASPAPTPEKAWPSSPSKGASFPKDAASADGHPQKASLHEICSTNASGGLAGSFEPSLECQVNSIKALLRLIWHLQHTALLHAIGLIYCYQMFLFWQPVLLKNLTQVRKNNDTRIFGSM